MKKAKKKVKTKRKLGLKLPKRNGLGASVLPGSLIVMGRAAQNIAVGQYVMLEPSRGLLFVATRDAVTGRWS